MAERYDHRAVEAKWQARWEREETWRARAEAAGERTYVLDMFPYPSAAGLHVGHPEGYTATDIYCRYLRMKGVEVLHPMGWDAFGLPAENYAIKTNRHPREVTAENIGTFRRQIKSLGFSYDWSREVSTADPSYYKWTQWLFLKLYEKGLAYQREAPVNWCPACQTVLANEQVVDGTCERSGDVVEQRQMRQWFFKITDYAERLLADLDGLDWPARISEMQRNWIGRSEGAEVDFPVDGTGLSVRIFTTRLDTIFGATYLVLAPEHELVQQLKPRAANPSEVEAYVQRAQRKTELERKVEEKEKTGVKLDGVVAVNPATRELVPIYIADYVLASYGTGAIMAVPAHDQRDWEFAHRFGLPIRQVICPNYPEPTCPVLVAAYTGEGHLVDSGEFNGLHSREAPAALAKKFKAAAGVQYKLRDWLISRQRYWGAPIPIIYCDTCGTVSVPEEQLPVFLPADVDFRPTGESPLARSKSFHDVVCPKCGKAARRESDTMDTFVDSSWYFFRYCDPENTAAAFDAKKVATWCPVNLYVGGAEHAVLHLLYARFMTKVLADLGYVGFQEPFVRLRNQGLILGEDGQKMSKSRGNVVNPDDIVEAYGADTLRVYEMFMGPLEDAKPWNTASISGVRRFLDRVWYLTSLPDDSAAEAATTADDHATDREVAKAVQKVTGDIEAFRFNTAISTMMALTNVLYRTKAHPTPTAAAARRTLVRLLYPFAPHLASELWERLETTVGPVWEQAWPSYDAAALSSATTTVVVQVDGKVRANVTCPAGASDEELVGAARSAPNVEKWLTGKPVARTVVKAGRLVNFVTRGA